MISEDNDGVKEREVLASVLWDDTVMASVSFMFQHFPTLMRSEISNAILAWGVQYYNKYNKAPREDVRLFPAEVAETDQDYSEQLSAVIEALRPPTSSNSARLLDIATNYFDKIHVGQLISSLSSKLSGNNLQGCFDSINNFSRITTGITAGVNPLTDEAALLAAYNDNTVSSLLKFDSPDATAFFGDTFSRASFVVINAAEKAGKCIEGSQKVLCADGVEREIREIVEGKLQIDVVAVDLALMKPVVVPISAWYCNGERICYRIKTESGRSLVCTKDHPLYSQSFGWKKAEDFSPGDRILMGNAQYVQWDRVTSMDYVGHCTVYDIEIPNRHNFIVGGFVAHNSSLLLEIAVQAVHQGRKVAYFEAGDMSQEQVFRRIYQRIAHHPRRAGFVDVPVSFSVDDNDYGSDVQINVVHDRVLFHEDMNIDLARQACEKWRNVCGEINWRFSAHPQNLTVPLMCSLLDEWERTDGFIPDFVIVDYADIINSVSRNSEYRHQINDTFSRLRGVSLDRKCCLLTATQANAGSWESATMTREHLSEDKRKAAHPTAILGLNASQVEREKQVAKLNFIVRRDDVCNEYDCLYLAQCLALCQPMAYTWFPAFRRNQMLISNRGSIAQEEQELEQAQNNKLMSFNARSVASVVPDSQTSYSSSDSEYGLDGFGDDTF